MENQLSPMGYTFQKKKIIEMTRLATEDVLIETDRNLQISFADGLCNTLVTGSTGSGKTASVALPCARALIKRRLPGFISIIKANFAKKIHSLAKEAGRENDIIMYGTGEYGTPCNILRNLSFTQTLQFLETMVRSHTQGVTENWIWLLKGIHQAAHCCQILQFSSVKYPELRPTLHLVGQMVMNPEKGIEIYKFFMNNIYDPQNSEHELVRSTVENQRFHILKRLDKKNISTSDEEQNTWNMQGVRMTLNEALSTPGFVQNFCDSEASAPDMGKSLKNNQLVLTFLDRSTGPVGDFLYRYLVNCWYDDILKMGEVKNNELRCFTLLDEFQQIADLGQGRLSDFRFTSLSREYGVINVILTQSEAALHVNCPNPYQVKAFLNNFNQRFNFYSNDPVTQDSAQNIDPDIHLTDLKPYQLFITHYDSGKRKHISQLDMLNNVFDATQKAIASNPAELLAKNRETSTAWDIVKIVNFLDEEQKRITERKKEKERLAREVRVTAGADKNIRDPYAVAAKMEDSMDNKRHQWEEDGDKLLARRNHMIKKEYEQDQAADNLDDPFVIHMRERFPDIFKNTRGWDIPIGWQPYVEKVFALFARSGLKARVDRFVIRHGGLRVSLHPFNSLTGDFFDQMFEPTRYLCLICGSQLPENPEKSALESDSSDTGQDLMDEYEDREDMESILPICPHCLAQAELEKYFPINSGMVKTSKP